MRDALDARSLAAASAYLAPNAFVELEGELADIMDTFTSLAPPIVLVCEVPGPASELLDDTDPRHIALLDEYAVEFADRPGALVIAAPGAGVLLGASFWEERWLDFEERVEAALVAEPVTAQVGDVVRPGSGVPQRRSSAPVRRGPKHHRRPPEP